MPELSFEVYCAKCGAGLCGVTTVSGFDVSVEPCANCLEIERETGYDDGYNNGYEDGYDGRGEDE